MPNLSDKILTQRLGDLVKSGLVVKNKSASGKISVYVLTKRARSLHSILLDLYVWGNVHATELGAQIEHPLRDV